MDEQVDMNCLTFEDLQDEYQKLKERVFQLSIVNEQDTQRIHELRRNLDTALAAEAYLVQELEQLSAVQASQDDALLNKKQSELDELKKRQSLLLTENEEMHRDVADLRAENTRLNQKIKELTFASQPAEISYEIPKEHLELRDRLEADNLQLLAKLDETHESVIKFTMSLAEKEKHIEILNDQVLCLEENLQSKREEVDEKSHLLESAQEQVVEMNAKIAMLTSCPENSDRKGNSLFAEVDDQRQAMKQLLAAQKKSYMHMKKVFNESQHEIRRLKRENVAMHNELQACSTIFCNADKTYKEKLNERILQLLKQNEDLEKKLMFTQQELISMANDKGVVWLDSMLLFCKQETEQLKSQLHSNRIQKGILEERLRNSQQDLAKWRFEALKTRCILIDRESLLTDNKIDFKIFTNKDVAFKPNELECAQPNIDFGHRSTLHDKKTTKNSKLISENFEMDGSVSTKVCQVPVSEVKDDNAELGDMQMSEDSMFKVKTEAQPSLEIRAIETENLKEIKGQQLDHIDSQRANSIKVECAQTPACSPKSKITESEIKLDITSSPKPLQLGLNNLHIKAETNDEQNKENICVSSLETDTLPKHCANGLFKEYEFPGDLKPRPSILIKKRNILDDESNTKTVHFAQIEKSGKSNQSSDAKFVCKSTRTKSNVIIRRILVNSKTKSEPGVPQ